MPLPSYFPSTRCAGVFAGAPYAFCMPIDPTKPVHALEKVIIAPDPPADGAAPPSTPYRTTDAFEAIVALEASRRENARLRSAQRQSRNGIVVALAASCMSLAVFSTALVLRHVPADHDMPLAMPCPFALPEIAPGENTDPLPPYDGPTLSELEAKTPLDDLGGEAALKPLAKEITAALLADPVLRKNPRIAAVGGARLETAVRQSLITLLDATAEPDALDTSELMWEIRPNHAEWAAASAVLEKALEKHGVSESNRSALASTVGANESSAVDDTTTRATGLLRRASVGLSCPEESITSRPLETGDARMVSGCGKRAIYTYVSDASTGVSAWHREPNP